jgi:Protein of unknown function (DUF3102)
MQCASRPSNARCGDDRAFTPAPATLAEHAAVIRALGKRVIGDVIEIGRRLTEAKIAGHGNWLPWLEREFGWSDDTALNYMNLAEMAKSRTVRDLSLPIKSLYLIAKPSTPDEARTEVIKRVESGEKLSVKDVQAIVDNTKGRKQPTSKPKPATVTQLAKPRTKIAQDRCSAFLAIVGLENNSSADGKARQYANRQQDRMGPSRINST